MDDHSVLKLSGMGVFVQIIPNTPNPNLALFILVLFILLMGSCLFSGASVAFFSLSGKDLNMLKARQNENARLIARLLEKPKNLVISISIMRFLLNIGFILVANYLINQWVSRENSYFISLTVRIILISASLILFVDILPKVYAMQNNIRMAIFVAPVVGFFHRRLESVSKGLVSFSDSFEKKLSGRNSSNVTLEEIDQAIESTIDESASQEEKDILKGIIKFGNITVKQIMKGRLDVSGIDEDSPFSVVIQQVGDLHYSRLPVYRKNLDTIIGIIHTKDLLPYLDTREPFDWHEVLRQPYFVHEHKLIEDLLRDFQSRHMHFAVVVDEFGGTSGIVTLEDIMEEVIGEIKDEFDEEEFSFHKIDESHFIFEGKIMLNDVCRIMNIPPDSFDRVKGDSDSLAGLILELAGEFPVAHQVIRYSPYDFKILETNRMRIQKVQVSLQEETRTAE
ncbi:MAG: gliding motility-associated protein GldE [Chitinophagaceae bacterium]